MVARLKRRLRDGLIIGIVGPALGVAAVVMIQLASRQLAGVGASSTHVAHSAVDAMRASRPPETLPPPAQPVLSATPVLPPEPSPPRTMADFGQVTPTPQARAMADWVVGRHDNGQRPFMVLDKRDARLYVFEPNGTLLGAAPVLLGAARGDDSFPGIGNVPIAQVKPWQRTTAAGRFVTQPGLDSDHSDVVWLDYDAALAMHRVINKVRSERRPERLASPSPADNRISFGCINIPIPFFDQYISPVFGKQRGVAYVMPEVKTFAQVFESDAPPAMAAGGAGAGTKGAKALAGR